MEWISIKERLPEDMVEVLLLNQYGEMGVSCLEPDDQAWKKQVYWHDAGMLPHTHFTHWMPLPERPEKEQP